MRDIITRPTLLERLRDASDAAAWRDFDDRYREIILTYCRRRGLQMSDAEDVRQMVMVNMMTRLPSFDYRRDRGRFRDYLGLVVMNAVNRRFRSPKPELAGLSTQTARRLEEVIDEPESERAWELEWMQHHYRRAMCAVRERVDPKTLEVFDRLLGGEEVREVAKQMGMSPDAVQKAKQRMKGRLREQVEAQVREEDGESQSSR